MTGLYAVDRRKGEMEERRSGKRKRMIERRREVRREI